MSTTATEKPEKRGIIVSVTVNRTEYEAIAKAAQMTDRTLSGFVRWTALEKLHEYKILVPSEETGEETPNER